MDERGSVTFDMSDAPCEIHGGPIGDCGCPLAFVDQQWIDRSIMNAACAAGEMVARREDEAILKMLEAGPAAFVDTEME